MKKIICALLCAVFMLSSCSGGVKLTDSKGAYAEAKNGIKYNYASVCYEPVALGEEYGELSVGDMFKYKVYTVPDMNAEQWLATEENNILYAQGVSLPTLTQMNANTIRIFTMEKSGIEVCRMGDKTVVAAVAKAFEEGERIEYSAMPAVEKYKVKFYGDTLKGVCYALTYLEYSEDIIEGDVNYGRYFLYDAFDRIFVPVGSEIHNALTDTAQTTAPETQVGGAV